jgi:hypothetical protein
MRYIRIACCLRQSECVWRSKVLDYTDVIQQFPSMEGLLSMNTTRAIWKGRGLAAVRRCYAEGGGNYYVKL